VLSDEAYGNHGNTFRQCHDLHNRACGTSRNTLGLIRAAGIEPTIIEYLRTPPDRATLVELLRRMGLFTRSSFNVRSS